MERRLGQGNFADVWKAHHRLGSNNKLTVAIKVIDKTQRSESDLTKIYREIEILKKLRHPHIIRLYQVFESGNYIFLGRINSLNFMVEALRLRVELSFSKIRRTIIIRKNSNN